MKPPFPADDPHVATLLGLALGEDLGELGDLTTRATVPEGVWVEAQIIAREACVVSGLVLIDPLANALAKHPAGEAEAANITVIESVDDGDRVEGGTIFCRLHGTARALLVFERPLLNFMGRMSGIATLTAEYVDVVRAVGSSTRVLDTRKTTPGHRLIEKYAVSCGGGANHRMGLYDAVLIKDNHVVSAGDVGKAVANAVSLAPEGIEIECECDRIDQIEPALDAGAHALLLDNFTPEQIREAIELIGRYKQRFGREDWIRVEASGGMNLDTIGAFAAAGPDDISVGRLTHSARSVDLSMEMVARSTDSTTGRTSSDDDATGRTSSADDATGRARTADSDGD